MRRAAIVSPLRTAVGIYGGTLRPVAVETLIATVIKALIARTGLDPMKLDDVIIAQSYANGEAPCIGRYAVLESDLPIEIPGYQLDRRCGSGLQAVLNAAMMVQTGAADVVLAGGVESMSNVEYYTTDMRWGKRAGSATLHDRLQRGRERSQPDWRFGPISGMIETAENLAKEYAIPREESDAYAMRSHQRAADAWKTGKFTQEVVPVSVPQPKGDPKTFAQDEGFRADASMETLAKLRPLMKNGTVTAGNASQQNDAAAACLVVAEEALKELKLEPMAYLAGWAAAGCDPATMGIGPVPAVRKALKRANLKIEDIGLIELNEAFAVQSLRVMKDLGLREEITNVNGGAIALGHPLGCSGARILTTLVHEMRRRAPGERRPYYGLATLCVGVGQGEATIVEWVGSN